MATIGNEVFRRMKFQTTQQPGVQNPEPRVQNPRVQKPKTQKAETQTPDVPISPNN
jgi:hypothetical protein